MDSGRITGLRRDDLDLDATLRSGQVFRWRTDADGAWAGIVGGRRRGRLRQNPDDSISWEADGPDGESAVRAFLRLDDLDLAATAELWCGADPHFSEAWTDNPGIRILRQEPEECFFSFLCASVAPIARIRTMLEGVASEYGDAVDGVTGDSSANVIPLLRFPSAELLAGAPERRLCELGLGFRARRLAEAARILRDLPVDHLPTLRHGATHAEAKQELTSFFGVGEKIADCVCLFSLDKDGAVPVDTHIWRMATTWYVPELVGKSLTPANYARVTRAFHDRFGPMAGWAQQTLFYRSAVGQSAAQRRANSPTPRRASSPTSTP